MRIFSLVIAFLLSFSALEAHDIHVSVTDVEISEDGDIEIVVKVFLDDLMNSVGLELGAELPDDYTSSDDLITQFLDDNFHFIINGERISYELEDTTHSSPAVWITLKSHTEEDIKTIEVENKILIELFDDQSNMVNISISGNRYSEMLDGDNTNYQVSVGK